jgi:hypothetical protein
MGGELCSFCKSKPAVVAADLPAEVGVCRECSRPHGPLRRLFLDAQRSRRPDYDSDAGDHEAKRVGLTAGDEVPDEAMALSLLDVFYPRASKASRAARFPGRPTGS